MIRIHTMPLPVMGTPGKAKRLDQPAWNSRANGDWYRVGTFN